MSERKTGNSRLVYNKETKTIVTENSKDAEIASLKEEMQGHIDVGESLMKEVKRLDKELAAAEKRERELMEKVEKAIKFVTVLQDHFDACDDCEEVLNMRADLSNLLQLLLTSHWRSTRIAK